MKESSSKLVNLDKSYGYIYVTINSVNNRCYVGQHKFDTTKPPSGVPIEVLESYRESKGHDMFKHNPNYLGSGKLILKAISKYGIENFYILDILDVASDQSELDQLEKYWIHDYKYRSSENLYNIADGGQGGDIISKLPKDQYDALCETHRLNSLKPDHPFRHCVKGSNNPMYGKKHSRETKERMSNTKKGTKASDETKLLMSINRTNNPKFRPPSAKGMILVNNGLYNKRINPEEFSDYEKLGYMRGRLSLKRSTEKEMEE